MKQKTRNTAIVTTSISFVFVAVLAALPQRAIAEDPSTASVNVFYNCCLKEKFPHVERTGGLLKAFDPKSGRNFAWDKDQQAWIDTKTLERVCPGKVDPPGTAPVNAFYNCCLKKKFPHVERTGGLLLAFDHDSGRNFAWDKGKQAWIDVKTGECICPTCSGQTATNVLKTIGSSIHIQIGGGGTFGHDEHHHGEDRHRTADKVSTDKTKTHTTSPTTTHKTVTAACKCHPCTCSPCTCH